MLASRPAPRLITSADHALALHPAGPGRVSIARRPGGGGWRETSVPVADLAYAMRHLAGEPDTYLTQNRFLGRCRLVARLAELDALFVDLDRYRTAHAGAHPCHVLSLALEALETGRIPSPSFAVASGRGLALVWLHHPMPRVALPRWHACGPWVVLALGARAPGGRGVESLRPRGPLPVAAFSFANFTDFSNATLPGWEHLRALGRIDAGFAWSCADGRQEPAVRRRWPAARWRQPEVLSR